MRILAVLVLLFAVGCDSTDLYKQDTKTWFGDSPTPPADMKGQAPAVGKTNGAPQ